MPLRRPVTPRRPAARRLLALAACAALGAGAAMALGDAPAPAPGDGARPAAGCPGADARPAALGAEATADAVRCLVNRERAAAGLPPLAAWPEARRAAAWHAADMARRGYYAHTTPPPAPHGRTPRQRAAAAGITAAVGEAIHRGPATPRAAVRGWLASARHCAVLLAPAGAGIGAAAAPAGGGRQVWTAVVVHRAAGAHRSAPSEPPACGRGRRAGGGGGYSRARR